jgi:hypothetical protein
MVNEKEDFHQRSGFNLTEVKFRIRMSIRILNSKSWTLEAGWGPEINLSEIKTGRRLGGACVDSSSRLVGDRSWIWIDRVLISVRLFTVWSNPTKYGHGSVWMCKKKSDRIILIQPLFKKYRTLTAFTGTWCGRTRTLLVVRSLSMQHSTYRR